MSELDGLARQAEHLYREYKNAWEVWEAADGEFIAEPPIFLNPPGQPLAHSQPNIYINNRHAARVADEKQELDRWVGKNAVFYQRHKGELYDMAMGEMEAERTQ